MQYGILIGRFQPLHLAHQSIINEIMHDGLRPLIFIGSCNQSGDKNPFSYVQRASMIHSIYGGEVTTLPLPDFPLNADWAFYIETMLYDINIQKKDCYIYYYRKEGDADLFPLIAEFNYRKPKYPEIYGLISASDIRANPEANKKYLDGRIYKLIKEQP